MDITINKASSKVVGKNTNMWLFNFKKTYRNKLMNSFNYILIRSRENNLNNKLTTFSRYKLYGRQVIMKPGILR